MATVRILYEPKASVRDLLSFARVQNQVAKSAVYAFKNPDTPEGTVSYFVCNFRTVSDRM
jgi:hypothetical protein